jgi:hypothetical protein
VVLAFVGAVFVVILRRGVWGMVDTVEDHGDALVVTLRGKKFDIPISNIAKV